MRLVWLALVAIGAHAQTEAQIRGAAERALKPIERSMDTFVKQRACFSCHHNGLGLTALREAQQSGLAVKGEIFRAAEEKSLRLLTMPNALDAAIDGREFTDPTPNDSFLLLASGGGTRHFPDARTVMERRLASWQQADGHWATSDYRPPHSYSRFTATATAVMVLSAARYQDQVSKGITWLGTHEPESTEDASFRLIGLAGRAADGVVQQAANELVRRGLPNGGWGQLPGYPADAYSTGQAVYALQRAGRHREAQAKGLRFLIRTQAADGTWRTRTRMTSPADVSPPYFKTGYPYGKDEFLSFAGASWTLRALAGALTVGNGVAGGRVSGSTDDPFATAVDGRAVDLAQLLGPGPSPLREQTRPTGVTLLMAAASGPDAEAKVRFLLGRGVDVKARSKSGVDALTVAASFRGNARVMEALLDAGAEVNPPKEAKAHHAPLVLAASSGDLEAVKLLLARGADPNLASRVNSPLTAAITFGHADVAAALLEAGAATDVVEGTGINLIHWATITNRPEVIPLLARAKVPLDAEDDNGFTPLHYAASIDFGDTRVLDALLAAGADRKHRNFENRTPRQEALRLGHMKLAARLAAGKR